ncbi:hypothetical protein [Piscirickettsia litoralis]|nr:hypothetical protein [Piscirickettsia litoralis]
MKQSTSISKLMNTDLVTVNQTTLFSELRPIMEKTGSTTFPLLMARN